MWRHDTQHNDIQRNNKSIATPSIMALEFYYSECWKSAFMLHAGHRYAERRYAQCRDFLEWVHKWRHDNQHNDTQHKELLCYTQHKWQSA